ncbi:kinase-like protein [Exidia glandulosa HHB12029]|uniref:Kinase-like protein n=1 Tax=Exidia glandulosa HHB12029 TaxID=1314781 RepID=A0A165J8F2_EXIGL|nr:kinase-like protein [Exidia glandulosa HHB12029]
MEAAATPSLTLQPFEGESRFQAEAVALDDGPVIIGRSLFKRNNPNFRCEAVSRRHAEVWEYAGQIWIRDLGSSNGTWVNSSDISRTDVPTPLATGDILQLGRSLVEEGRNGRGRRHGKLVARVIVSPGARDYCPPAPIADVEPVAARMFEQWEVQFDRTSVPNPARSVVSWRQHQSRIASGPLVASPTSYRSRHNPQAEALWRRSFSDSLDSSTILQGSIWLSPDELQRDFTGGSNGPIKCGGLSDIYRGTLQRVDEGPIVVAIKRLRDGAQPLTKIIKSLENEVSIWQKLEHPYILQLYGLLPKRTGKIPDMISPWCEKGHILDYLRELQDYEYVNEVKVFLLYQVALGLRYLHKHRPSIVHGDLKGANILISDDGRVQLCDFGLSKIMAEHGFSVGSSGGKGTCRFMAPELFASDDARPTAASDIWAYGCVIIEVVSGLMPYFTKSRNEQVIWALGRNELPARPNNVTDDQWAVALQCWEIQPSRRPSAAAVAERMRALNMQAFVGIPGTMVGSSVCSITSRL